MQKKKKSTLGSFFRTKATSNIIKKPKIKDLKFINHPKKKIMMTSTVRNMMRVTKAKE